VEVFHTAACLRPGAYAVDVVTPSGAAVRTTSGLTLGGAPLDDRPVDTLVVAGGTGVRTVLEDASVVAWTRAAAARSRRTTSVCTGALVLGAAGLLDGRGRRRTGRGATSSHGPARRSRSTPSRSSSATATSGRRPG
jgi:transcriptional regulator GlxA family with amidase domain